MKAYVICGMPRWDFVNYFDLFDHCHRMQLERELLVNEMSNMRFILIWDIQT